MNKFIKTIPVFLTVVMILCCSVFVPAMAYDYCVADDGSVEFIRCLPSVYMDVHGDFFEDERYSCVWYILPVGDYTITFAIDSEADDLESFDPIFCFDGIACMNRDYFEGSPINIKNGVFSVTSDMLVTDENDYFPVGYCCIAVNTISEDIVLKAYDPVIPPEDDPSAGGNGIYYGIFDLLADFIYGDGAVLTGDQTLTLTILATTAVLFVVVVPFLVVFFVLRLFR